MTRWYYEWFTPMAMVYLLQFISTFFFFFLFHSIWLLHHFSLWLCFVEKVFFLFLLQINYHTRCFMINWLDIWLFKCVFVADVNPSVNSLQIEISITLLTFSASTDQFHGSIFSQVIFYMDFSFKQTWESPSSGKLFKLYFHVHIYKVYVVKGVGQNRST